MSFQWIDCIQADHNPKPRWLVVSSHNDHYHLWRDSHWENHMQWVEIKAMKERLSKLDEEMTKLKVKEEDIGSGVVLPGDHGN